MPVDVARANHEELGEGEKRSAPEQHHRFDVKRLRKEIEQVCFLDSISGCQQKRDIPGQRCRITRNIAHTRGSKFHQRSDYRLAGTGTGRV